MSVSLTRVSRDWNAVYLWSWGKREQCRVIVRRDDRAYVEWPESVRTISAEGHVFTGQRMPAWVDAKRLESKS